MKQKLLKTMRMLLVAVLLGVGAGNAWATVTPFSESYSSTSPTTGWTTGTGGRFSPTILNKDDNYFLSVNQSERNNNGTTVTGTVIAGKAAAGDNFTLIFDMWISGHSDGTKVGTKISFKDAANSGVILSLQEPQTANQGKWNINGTETQLTLPNSGSGKTVADNLTWCTYKISRSGALTYLTVTNKATSAVIFERAIIAGASASGGLGNIVFETSRYNSNFAIDNIVVRELEEGDVPTVTYYTATFTETNSLKPTVKIYSNAGRTSEVTNGALADETTYYYTAILEAYNNYEGSFTVDGANPSVSFTMTAKPRYTFTVNAINSVGGAVITTFYTDVDSYDGKKHNVSFPAYLTGAGNAVTYFKANSTYYQSYTSASDDATKTQSYTEYTGEAYFFEGEDVTGATTYTTGTFGPRSSSGATGVLDAKTVTSLDAGTYKLTARSIGKASNTHSIYKTSTEGEKIFDIITSTSGATNSAIICLDATTDIVANGGYYTTTDNGHGFDYILIEKNPTVPATIGSTGFATFSNANYALDFTGLAVKAYKATLKGDNTILLSPVTEVPANTGLLLAGAADSYDIPVIATASAIDGNLLKASSDTDIPESEAGTYHYVLANGTKGVGFYNLAAAKNIGAGKAYLETETALTAESSTARIAWQFADDDTITGVSNLTPAITEGEGAVYNLNGQRVNAPAKGLYIKNGKKVVIK